MISIVHYVHLYHKTSRDDVDLLVCIFYYMGFSMLISAQTLHVVYYPPQKLQSNQFGMVCHMDD